MILNERRPHDHDGECTNISMLCDLKLIQHSCLLTIILCSHSRTARRYRVPERNVIDNLCYHVRDGNGVVFHLINKFMLCFDLVWKENGNAEVMACPRLLLCSIIISKVIFIDVIDCGVRSTK